MIAPTIGCSDVQRLRRAPRTQPDPCPFPILPRHARDALVLGVALLAFACAPAPEPAAPTPPPSIVIYLTDTLRADRLGAYGCDCGTSPRFDAFAREAVVFDDAWAVAPWTRPALGSLFTGIYPPAAEGFDRGLPKELATLAEILKDAGYRTGAVVANHLVNERTGFSQGFDDWNGGDPELYGISAAEVVRRGLRFVEAAQPAPFFLFLHTLEPHEPYEPSAEAYRLFGAGEVRRPSKPLLKRARVDHRTRRYLEGLYAGEIWDNDRAFGALLDGLRTQRALDSSFVIFTADHGEELWDHGARGHGRRLYQELLRVPLAVRLPGGSRGGAREASPFGQIDLLPTLAGVLGLRAPATDGHDLSPRWLGRQATPPAVELLSQTRFAKADKQAIRHGPWKLIVSRDASASRSKRGSVELYDLVKDPRETRNLADTRTDIVARLESRLVSRGLARSADPPAARELPEEDREALRALGYIE